jgi:gamma-glutamyl:cysteine ligase YbdK (ATP-grasp superfamily)
MSGALHLFEGFGVELEYMIVAEATLDVLGVTDEVLKAIGGVYEAEVEVGELCWSNELVLHVVELKTNGPTADLVGLGELFQHHVGRINGILSDLDGLLLPTAMHPWMDPHRETELWPHEYSPVYEAFDRIFGCQGHGWSNLQSAHINLPFANDEEFGRLHAAIRLILPILPGLAASSPVADGRVTGMADHRLEVYRHNSKKVPSVSGRVIPEQAFSRSEYESMILQPLYRDIAPHDIEGILQYEWLNARGAIARFDRHTIEIRVLDVQECPRADLAIVQLVVGVLRAMVSERWCSYGVQKAWAVEPLEEIFLNVIREGDRTAAPSVEYLRCFGADVDGVDTVGDLWRSLAEALFSAEALASAELSPLVVIFEEGSLSQRITTALGPKPDRAAMNKVYRQLSGCLGEGRMFHGAF